MIRKISFGVDYKNAMHYSVHQRFGKMTITNIRQKNTNHYEIWIMNDQRETFLWKEIINMPVVVEMDIDSFS